MKKSRAKLRLDRETVRALDPAALRRVQGGCWSSSAAWVSNGCPPDSDDCLIDVDFGD